MYISQMRDPKINTLKVPAVGYDMRYYEIWDEIKNMIEIEMKKKSQNHIFF